MQSSSLEVLSVFQSQGSAQVCIWDNDLLLTVAYQSGVLQWWTASAEMIKEAKVEDIESVIHLNWSVQEKGLWIGSITSLTYTFIEQAVSTMDAASYPLKSLSLVEHKVAGCGLSFKDRFTLATGDLAGNIFINKGGTDFNFRDAKKQNQREKFGPMSSLVHRFIHWDT